MSVAPGQASNQVYANQDLRIPFPAAGGSSTTVPLNNVTAATASSTANHGVHQIAFTWAPPSGAGLSITNNRVGPAAANTALLNFSTADPTSNSNILKFTHIGNSIAPLDITIGANAGPPLGVEYPALTFRRPDGTPLGAIIQESSNSMAFASTSSDMRLKHRMPSFKQRDALAALLDLDVFDFYFKDDEKKRIRSGIDAEQMQEVLPECVMELAKEDDPEQKCHFVNYDHVIPLLIRAVQELYHQKF